MSEPEDKILKMALSMHNRTKKRFLEDVQAVKSWIETQPHLPEIMDDARVRNFLLLNKCSIEKTKEKINNYYRVRTLMPELYLEAESAEINKVAEIVYFLSLPKLTENLCRVHILKLRKKELIDELEPIPLIARGLQVQEVRLKEECMLKDIVIFDIGGLTWSYILKITPSLLLKCVKIYEKVYSNRIDAMYVVNSSTLIDASLAVLKKVAKPKIFQRIHVCDGTDILQIIFPKDMLPADYGGQEKSLEELYEQQKVKMSEYKEWLNCLNNLKVEENLRPEPLRNDEILGFYGNFKKLDVD